MVELCNASAALLICYQEANVEKAVLSFLAQTRRHSLRVGWNPPPPKNSQIRAGRALKESIDPTPTLVTYVDGVLSAMKLPHGQLLGLPTTEIHGLY